MFGKDVLQCIQYFEFNLKLNFGRDHSETIPFVTERREGIGGDFIVKRHSLCVDGVLRDTRKTRV